MCMLLRKKMEHMKQNLILKKLKEETDQSIIVVGNFNASFSTIGGSVRQKISKDIEEPKNITNKQDLIDISRIFYLRTEEYPFKY